MNLKYVLTLLITASMLSFGLPKNIQKKVNKTIKSTFKVEMFELNPIHIKTEIITTLPSTFNNKGLYKIISEDTFLGYAYIAKAPSRDDNFDYLVLFDKNLVIIKSKILIYREDYGEEIGSKRWLKQLIGKNENDILVYGDNIAAISGATISVRSMTMAINKLLEAIKILHHKNII